MEQLKKLEMAKIVGRNIYGRRKNLGMTQAELSEKIGVGADALSRFEKGTITPKYERLPDIAAALNCSVPDLFRTEDAPVGVKLGIIEDMLRPMPNDLQEDVICMMANMIQLMKKHL